MKILQVDTFGDDGHGYAYKYAMTNEDNENVYILPRESKSAAGKVYISPFQPYAIYASKFTGFKAFAYPKWLHQYREWLKYVRIVADAERPDIIHFMNADSLLPAFGMSLDVLKGFRIVLSFHRLHRSFIRSVSRNLIIPKVSAFISHIMGAEDRVSPANRSKYNFVPYPSALENIFFTSVQARELLNIHTDRKIIAFVGSMRPEKGVETFLEALADVKLPYYLLFAGWHKNRKEYLEAELEKVKAPKTVMLRSLSNEEFVACIAASDILAVPYTKAFEAASGPMTEAIRLRKTIVGSNHANIGQYIRKYGVGYSCEAGYRKGLTQALEKALTSPIVYTQEMNELAESQTVSAFRKNIDAIYRTVLQQPCL